MVGLNDTFAESGEPHELSVKYKLMPMDIVEAAERVLRRKKI
jgi:transketolase C-terminal domain/subunit